MRGELSAGLERLVAEAVKPVVDWRRVLREFVSDRAKTEYSFARPKRRFLAQDLYLAGLNGEALGPLVIAVDCSGSVSDEDLAKFSAEINSIREETKPAKIKIIYFDSEILEPAKGAATEFGPEDEIELTPVGGGGTAFSPIFRAIGECEDPAPCACIVLTDLVCSDYGPAPAYPVLWTISNGRGGPYAPPFGATVEILDK
jgi:predicted metal-dependent peptidase